MLTGVIAARVGFVVLGLALWFLTQRLIAAREVPSGRIDDQIHRWLGAANAALLARWNLSRALLIVSSGLIDAVGIFLLASAIFGPTIRPFLGLVLLFGLRQISQALTALPTPDGMIWKHPGFPSLLVTYGTANDFFFSGHTAVAVLGAVELVRTGSTPLAVLGVAIAVFEAVTVLALRAHWTMDVFTGAITALWIGGLSPQLAPHADALIRRGAGLIHL